MRVRQQLRSKEERGRWQNMAVTACRGKLIVFFQEPYLGLHSEMIL